MRNQHRLRATHMCVSRHQGVAGRSAWHERADQPHQCGLQHRNPATQVEPQIERHLIVARAAGVQPLARVADGFDQLALDEGVHVLVVAVDERRIARAPARARSVSAAWMAARSSAENTPAASIASAQARLPVMSSSTRRLSNGNERPKANTSLSGSPVEST